MNQKLILKSLCKMKLTRKSMPIVDQNINLCNIPNSILKVQTDDHLYQKISKSNYEEVSKANIVRLLEEALQDMNDYKKKYEKVCMDNDSMKIQIIQLSDKIRYLNLEVVTSQNQIQELKKYANLLQQKHQADIKTFMLEAQCKSQHQYKYIKNNIQQSSYESDYLKKDQSANIINMYKNKLEQLINEFEQYKQNRNNSTSQHRRLLQIQIIRTEQLEKKLEATTQQYVVKQEQIDFLKEEISKYQLLQHENYIQIQNLKVRNQTLLQELEQNKVTIINSRSQKENETSNDSKIMQIEKMNQNLKLNYDRKISLIQQTQREYQKKIEKQKQYARKYREERNILKTKNQQLQRRLRAVEDKYIQSSVILNNIEKQNANLQFQLRAKQRQQSKTNQVMKCYLTEKSSKSNKYHQSRSMIMILVRQVKQLRGKLVQLKSQVEYSANIRKQQILKWSKQCQSFISLSFNIKDSRIRKLVQENNMMNEEWRAITERDMSGFERIKDYKHEEGYNMKKQMKRLQSQIQKIRSSDDQKKYVIKQLRHLIKNTITQQYQKSQELQQRNKTMRSKSTYNTDNQYKSQRNNCIVSEIYNDIEQHRKKLYSTRENLNQYR